MALREPRPQSLLPDTPPLTPPQHGFKAGSPEQRLSELPGANSGTIGLGLGYNYAQRKMSALDERKAAPGSAGIANPYALQARTQLAALVRVPRRFRPVLLLATALAALGLILLTRRGADLAPLVKHHQAAPRHRDGLDLEAVRGASRAMPKPFAAARGEAITFQTREDELLALIGFMNAATGNILPASIDPSHPLDPALVVGFDPKAATAADDLALLKEEVNLLYPLVLFGRLRDPLHAAVIDVLDKWDIRPAPLVVDIDQRRDSERFIPVLERLLDTDDFPQLVLLGRSMGHGRDILAYDEEELVDLFNGSGAVTVRPRKGKGKKAKGRGRDRHDKILKPDFQFV